jgi:hypothetical protein
MAGRARGRGRLGLLAVGSALVALGTGPGIAGVAHAASPAVASLSVGAVTGGALSPLPAGSTKTPSVITAVGRQVTVHVDFLAADGTATSFGKATDLALTTGGGGSSTTTVGKDATFADLTSLPFTSAVNRTTVTVSVPSSKGKGAIAAQPSLTVFDVLLTLDAAVPVPTNGIVRNVGKDGADCGEVTESAPMCATVILPYGVVGNNVVLGTGACGPSGDAAYTLCDANRGSFVLELLADLGPAYTQQTPATVILSCDKKFCGKGSIQKNVPSFTPGGNTTLVKLLPCTAKGVAPATGACVDYVQSTRDNAGDTHLWVLFAEDARVTFP